MTIDATIAARVPVDLRTALERRRDELKAAGVHYPDGREADLSYVIRQACRAYVGDRSGVLFERPPSPAAELELRGGSARASDPATSKAAAAAQGPPRVGSQRWRALVAFAEASLRGLTADEVVVKLAPAPHNGTARRVTDLLQGGYIEQAPPLIDKAYGKNPAERARLLEPIDPDAKRPRINATVERKTRAGAWAQVYRITDKGRDALAERRRDERDPAGRR